MKKIIGTVLGMILAFSLNASVANAAAKEVRVAYFLEWPSPNLEDMNKKAYSKALGVPVKWTNFTNGVAMTDAIEGRTATDAKNTDPGRVILLIICER